MLSIPTTVPPKLDFSALGFSANAEADYAKHALLGEIHISGVSFYVEAIEVKDGTAQGSMTALNSELQDRIDAVAQFDAGGDRPGYATVEEQGHHFFVLIYPHQR